MPLALIIPVVRSRTCARMGSPWASRRTLKVPCPVRSRVIGKPQMVLSGSTTKLSSIGKWPVDVRVELALAGQLAAASAPNTARLVSTVRCKVRMVVSFSKCELEPRSAHESPVPEGVTIRAGAVVYDVDAKDTSADRPAVRAGADSVRAEPALRGAREVRDLVPDDYTAARLEPH